MLVLVGEQRNICPFAYWGGLGSGMELRRNVRLTTEYLLMLTEVSQVVASTIKQCKARYKVSQRTALGGQASWWRQMDAIPYLLRLRAGKDQIQNGLA